MTKSFMYNMYISINSTTHHDRFFLFNNHLYNSLKKVFKTFWNLVIYIIGNL